MKRPLTIHTTPRRYPLAALPQPQQPIGCGDFIVHINGYDYYQYNYGAAAGMAAWAAAVKAWSKGDGGDLPEPRKMSDQLLDRICDQIVEDPPIRLYRTSGRRKPNATRVNVANLRPDVRDYLRSLLSLSE